MRRNLPLGDLGQVWRKVDLSLSQSLFLLDFLKDVFYVRTVWDLQKSCKASMEFPYTSHNVSPVADLYYAAFVAIREPMLVHYN